MAALPITVRLNANDNVVVARVDTCRHGAEVEGLAATQRIPAGHKVATRPIPLGEPVRKFDQIIGFATQDIAPGRAHPCPQLRHARVRTRLCRGPGRAADADGAGGRAASFGGYRAWQRQGRHAQLYRHPVDGELLGLGLKVHRRALSGRGAGTIPERRRDRRHHPRHRLRHGRSRRGLRHPAAHAVGLRGAPEFRLDPDDRAGLRGDAALLHEGGLRYPVGADLPHHDAAGRGRHAAHDRAGARDDRGDAAARQRVRPPAGLGRRDQAWRCSAAARTAIPASPPIRRWATAPICWSATAARRSCRRRPRSTGPSTCLPGAPSARPSPTSWSSASTGGRSIASATAAR